MPITLAIETSNPSAWEATVPVRPGVAVIGAPDAGKSAQTREFRVLAVEEIDPGRPHDDDLIPAIDRAMKRAGLGPADLSRAAVSCGPGGFTAVRMAVTAAKSIADALGIELVLVPSVLSVAAAARGLGRVPASVQEPFLVALASKDQSAWVAPFDARGRLAGEQGVLGAAEIAPSLARVLVADRFLPASMREAALAAGVRIVPPIFDPVACGAASLAIKPTDPVAASPIYPRPAEAIRKWEEAQARKKSG